MQAPDEDDFSTIGLAAWKVLKLVNAKRKGREARAANAQPPAVPADREERNSAEMNSDAAAEVFPRETLRAGRRD